jgi:hypothetical protein
VARRVTKTQIEFDGGLTRRDGRYAWRLSTTCVAFGDATCSETR